MTSQQLKLMEKPIKKQEWLQMFLWLPQGIPSHGAFGRICGMLEAEELEKSFLSWLSSDPICNGNSNTIKSKVKMTTYWLSKEIRANLINQGKLNKSGQT